MMTLSCGRCRMLVRSGLSKGGLCLHRRYLSMGSDATNSGAGREGARFAHELDSMMLGARAAVVDSGRRTD
jgi:hypothetical protein